MIARFPTLRSGCAPGRNRTPVRTTWATVPANTLRRRPARTDRWHSSRASGVSARRRGGDGSADDATSARPRSRVAVQRLHHDVHAGVPRVDDLSVSDVHAHVMHGRVPEDEVTGLQLGTGKPPYPFGTAQTRSGAATRPPSGTQRASIRSSRRNWVPTPPTRTGSCPPWR